MDGQFILRNQDATRISDATGFAGRLLDSALTEKDTRRQDVVSIFASPGFPSPGGSYISASKCAHRGTLPGTLLPRHSGPLSAFCSSPCVSVVCAPKYIGLTFDVEHLQHLNLTTGEPTSRTAGIIWTGL